MRSTIYAVALLALFGCEHKAKKKADAPPPPGSAAKPTDPNAPPEKPAVEPVGDTVRPPTAADLETYVKDLPGSGNKLLAKFETSMGVINCELFPDKAPMTVANFVGLATGKKPWMNPSSGNVEKQKPFFDGLTFHRVIAEFMIQGGDPLGVGRGGPGYQFGDETTNGLKMEPGTLAMANAGPGTNGSQFFITEGAPEWLNGKHTIFGKCADLEVVKKIARVPQDRMNKPDTPITMKVVISKG